MKRVIIVDDDADLRLSLKLAFELAGYIVEVAANGREALALQCVFKADFLITDIFMPDSDGFEAIDGFRREFPQTKIVVISGAGRLATREYLSVAALIGANATLQKPFEIEALLSTLRSI